MCRAEVLESIKSTVARIEPAAEVILYGSRAREEDVPGSDWDILVLTPSRPDAVLKQAIRAGLYEIEWATGEVISAIVRGRDDWEALRVGPFHRNIEREGLRL